MESSVTPFSSKLESDGPSSGTQRLVINKTYSMIYSLLYWVSVCQSITVLGLEDREWGVKIVIWG